MGWQDVIRSALATAQAVLDDGLLATVVHYPYAGQNAYGETTWGDGVSRKAVVVDHDELIRDAQAREIVAHTRLTFLTAVTVDPRDKITLPDGRTTPILRVDHGVRDTAGAGFLTEVWF